MKDENNFTFKLKQSRKLNIVKSFDFDSKIFLEAVQSELQKRKFETEQSSTNVFFRYAP
ncbi:hypothetical protein B0O79_0598 [Flavobacteriaceae bacterium MAR_2009_75]|nr:hypothetical protein B0O79_0598 [Flavobacteriaceae bacterium MAR_2009_75]